MDLCVSDLWQGKVTLDKLGACPSMVICGDTLRVLESSALPLGILPAVQSSTHSFAVDENDMVIQFTDGLADACGGMRALEGQVQLFIRTHKSGGFTMSKRNWRNLQWRQMHHDQKLWFILMCLLLLLILVAAALDGMEIIKIPDWAALLWVAASLYTVYRNVYGLHMYDDSETDDDDDDDFMSISK